MFRKSTLDVDHVDQIYYNLSKYLEVEEDVGHKQINQQPPRDSKLCEGIQINRKANNNLH